MKPYPVLPTRIAAFGPAGTATGPIIESRMHVRSTMEKELAHPECGGTANSMSAKPSRVVPMPMRSRVVGLSSARMSSRLRRAWVSSTCGQALDEVMTTKLGEA